MSFVTIGVTTNPFKEDLRDRHERGFQHLEIRMSESLLIGRRVEIVRELERTLDEYDLEIVSIHVPELRLNGQPVDFASFDEENRTASAELVDAALSVAASIGAPRVVVTLPPFLDQKTLHAQDPARMVTLVRYRILNELEKFVDRAEREKILFCLKNAAPIIESGPAVGDFFGLATALEVQETIRKLSEFTRAWFAFDIANAHLFTNAWAAAREGNQRVAWLERLGIEVPLDIERVIRDFAELIEIFYVSNVRGLTEKGLILGEGEINIERVYRQILTCIFPARIIVLDAQEENEEKAMNAELMLAYLREIDQRGA